MIAIGQYPEGISLNAPEWLLDTEDGEIKFFNTKKDAIDFITTIHKEAGEDLPDIEDIYIFAERTDPFYFNQKNLKAIL